VEAEALYNLLERDVVPLFYERDNGGLPRRWIARMKASIGSLCYYFNTHRMVQEYTERFYLPGAKRYQQLTGNDAVRAVRLAAWKRRIEAGWPEVKVEAVETEAFNELQVGDTFHARARVSLGSLTPEDVRVELYLGRVDPAGELVDAQATLMQPAGQDKAGSFSFETSDVTCFGSGQHGYTVRVLPYHPDLTTPFLPGLIVWARS
jgi:starch phosphorylase